MDVGIANGLMTAMPWKPRCQGYLAASLQPAAYPQRGALGPWVNSPGRHENSWQKSTFISTKYGNNNIDNDIEDNDDDNDDNDDDNDDNDESNI